MLQPVFALVHFSFRATDVRLCIGASSVRRGLKASSIINVTAFRVASNVPLPPDGIPEYQCITHTRNDSSRVTNSVSVCHREANSAQCRPCVNSCDRNPPPTPFFFSSPHLPTHPPSRRRASEAPREGQRRQKVTAGRGGHEHSRTPSLLFMVVRTLVACMRS